MQTKYNSGIVNALAIGACSPNSWSSAAFRVTVDGALYASNIHISGGIIAIEDEGDKWVELGGKGGLRVVDLEVGSDDLVPCA
jgi:hypothetical protein